MIYSFFQRQKTTQFSPLYHKFLSLSWGNSLAPDSAQMFKGSHGTQEWKIYANQKPKVKENSCSFTAISLAKGARDICHFNSIASPSVLGIAVVQIKQFPKSLFQVNAVEMMNQKSTLPRRNYVPFWSQGYKRKAVLSVGHDTGDKYSRDLSPQDNYCPTFGSDRHRGLGWGLKCKDQIKESSLWILLRSPPCHAPKASQGFAMDDYEGIKSSS